MTNTAKHKTRIMIVDDDQDLVEMYKDRLKYAGYKVIIAHNGEQALAEAIAHIPHLILLDVIMTKINGFDVLDILKNHVETKNIPVVILTSLNDDKYKKRGLKYGASDYIVKSEVIPKQVVEKIEKVIASNKKKLEQLAQ